MKRITRTALIAILFSLQVLQQSCSYKLSGASIPPDMKTISVDFFENNSSLVVPYLSQSFTEELKNRIRNQTRLGVIRADADANLQGRISDYSIRPVAVQGNERAGLNRLSITVSVKYTNVLKPEQSFEQSFTRFQDIDLNAGALQTQESRLIPLINRQLSEDIFNRAFANW
ncbi:MAG: LptE family protein [Flavobacterium sp.]|nr:LptE family protein [Pedobacter sp.]